jgi:raffinose/stachyose/melibiose transport system permease protein
MKTGKKGRLIFLMVFPCLLLYTIVAISPLFQSLYFSFFSWKGFGEMKFVGIGNYIKMLTGDSVMRIAIRNVILWALTSVVVLIPLSFLLANSLNSNISFSKTFSAIFYLPGILSTVIVSLMWGAILNADFGILNSVLNKIGLGRFAKIWLGDPKITIFVVILVCCWQWAGYHMLIFYASIQAIPYSIYEAAYIDGVNGFTRLFKITIPLMASTIKMNLILLLIGTFKSFDLVYIMTAGGPADSTQMFATYMYESTFHRFNYGYGSAISMLIFMLSILGSVLLQRWNFGNETIQY